MRSKADPVKQAVCSAANRCNDTPKTNTVTQQEFIARIQKFRA